MHFGQEWSIEGRNRQDFLISVPVEPELVQEKVVYICC